MKYGKSPKKNDRFQSLPWEPGGPTQHLHSFIPSGPHQINQLKGNPEAAQAYGDSPRREVWKEFPGVDTNVDLAKPPVVEHGLVLWRLGLFSESVILQRAALLGRARPTGHIWHSSM
ncbi:hypothetical protein DPEC_G00221400 [Dallia pectoralis]|uniref:Uncharacterized protein n=1 Tax=Dallia pectoralis TaxID=75939 RepID=A0ACC2G4B3_DALPE|nr:hypothetical protein DPEC_G00221400 [Dallia pectoralis]